MQISVVRRLFWVGALAILFGCSVSEDSLVGEWRLDSSFRERLPLEYRQAKGVLTLLADGTFKAEELPIKSFLPILDLEYRYCAFTGSGEWKVDRTSGQVVRLSLEESINEEESLHLPYEDFLAISWELEWQLVYYLNDPDSDDVLFFDKVESIGSK